MLFVFAFLLSAFCFFDCFFLREKTAALRGGDRGERWLWRSLLSRRCELRFLITSSSAPRRSPLLTSFALSPSMALSSTKLLQLAQVRFSFFFLIPFFLSSFLFMDFFFYISVIFWQNFLHLCSRRQII